MEAENNVLKIFILVGIPLLREALLQQANSLRESGRTYEFYFFDDMLQTLAHTHLTPDLIIADADTFDAAYLLEQTKITSPPSSLIFIGQKPELRKAIQLIQAGASDFFDRAEVNEIFLSSQIKKIREQLFGNEENTPKITLIEKFKEFGFIGNSRVMRKLYRAMENAARNNNFVCVIGESGSGKELVARTIHQLSKRAESALLLFDICSVPESLLETTLFGQEKNVFEGILHRQIGILEQARGGTLIIDNIDLLPMPLQSKLQRAFQEKKFIRPGGQNIVFLSTRIIVLSQKNLLQEIEKGVFRKDLYFQLAEILIEVPPLRKRGQDILSLAGHILRDFIRKNKLKNIIFTQSAKDVLLNHPFPGNIRELKAIVESSAIMASPPEISKEDLIFHEVPSVNDWLGEDLTLEEFNIKIILYYLEKYENDVLQTAKKLDIGKSTVYRLLKKIK